MRNFSIILVFCFLNSCAGLRNKNIPCDQLGAKSIDDKQMKRNGFKLKQYSVSIEETASYFLIIYTDTRLYRSGGGGEIKVAKSTCRIIDRVFQQ